MSIGEVVNFDIVVTACENGVSTTTYGIVADRVRVPGMCAYCVVDIFSRDFMFECLCMSFGVWKFFASSYPKLKKKTGGGQHSSMLQNPVRNIVLSCRLFRSSLRVFVFDS